MPSEPVQLPLPTDPKVILAEDLIKDVMRERSHILFSEWRLWRRCEERTIRTQLSVGPDFPVADVQRVFSDAAARAAKSCPGLSVTGPIDKDGDFHGIWIELRGPTEWETVRAYAYTTTVELAATILTRPSQELVARIRSRELAVFRSELSVRHRLSYFGNRNFDELFKEIREKQDLEVKQTSEGDPSRQRTHRVKFSIGPAAKSPPSPPVPPAWNPSFPFDPNPPGAHRRFCVDFLSLLSKSPFSGSEKTLLWRIGSRTELFHAFPHFLDDPPFDRALRGYFAAACRPDSFQLEARFYHQSPWEISLTPVKDWDSVRADCRSELALANPEKEFGLTPEAAALFEWVRRFLPDKLDLGLTPEVEEAMRVSQLLLSDRWGAENTRTLITILCEEITELTPYSLRPFKWEDRGWTNTRIRVRPKPIPKPPAPKPAPTLQREMLTSSDVRKLFTHKTASGFWQFVYANGVPHIRLGPRKIVFEESALNAWLERRSVGSRRSY